MPSNEIVTVKRADKPPEKPKRLGKPPSQTAQPLKSERLEVQQLEIELPEQPEPAVHLESLAEPTREESVYGSGWSITELMHEFSGRSSG